MVPPQYLVEEYININIRHKILEETRTYIGAYMKGFMKGIMPISQDIRTQESCDRTQDIRVA